MVVEYPDVMNDIIEARLRYESRVVQYLAEFPSKSTPAGDVAQLTLVLQSVMEVPVDVGVHLALPRPRRRLKRLPQPLFQIFQPDIRLTLEEGEAGQLVIPVHVQPQVPPGEYAFTIRVLSWAAREAIRRRPERRESQIGDLKIRHPQGLGISQIVSWGYKTKKKREQVVSLIVSGAREPPESVDIKPHFSSLWTPQDWESVAAARSELNNRRVHVLSELTAEAVYLPFLRETQASFANSGVRFHVAEAVFLAKILTYTVTYLMRNAEWQDCLLIPIYAYAQANEQATDDAVWLVTRLGYMHVLGLAIALSFSLVEEALQREVWDWAVQRALRRFIVECLDTGAALPAEFLYLPLILGGIAVANEVVLGDGDVQASLHLLAKAKAGKANLFADAELKELNDAFDQLIARQRQG